jgi:type I restriction-modification system DNA methylase subunit
MYQMASMTESITNREALREKIHEIHNYIRNHGAGYGMNGLKLFNVLYGLKKIEEKGLLDKTRLKRPECEFSYLLKLARSGEDETLSKTILRDVLDSLYESDLKGFLYYDLSRHLKSSIFAYLIKEIDNITRIEETCNVLLSGKIYEYFVGRDESAISELGAYFTDRHIVNYILDKLDPVVEDGEVPSMIDMFGGSGGFTTGYIDYLQKKAEETDEVIDWETQLKQVSHYDMNEDVVKSAGLEFFCLTGVLPKPKQLFYKNSFTDNFEDDKIIRKYHYVLTNPPYGGDKNSKSAAQEKRDKVKAFLKSDVVDDEEVCQKRKAQLKRIEAEEKADKKRGDKSHVSVSSSSPRIQKFAKDHGLKGNDKETCSLMLMMDMIEVGGTAIGVLKEGVFFNKTYKDLRRCLVENYNVREVISVPQDQFENTKTKTSIVIFDNTEAKTSEVVFRDLVVEHYEEDTFAENVKGDVVLLESKGDICCVSDTIVSSATRAELLASLICSLNGKDYSKKEIVVGEGYELYSLNELCDIRIGTRITKKSNIEGKIPVYGGGDITFHTNKINREKNTLIVSRYALSKCCVRLITTDFFLNDSGLSLQSKKKELQNYIKYILLSKTFQDNIYINCTSGSIQRNLNMNLFRELKIPVPKSPTKIQEWVDKISDPSNSKELYQQYIRELSAEAIP